MAASWDEAIDSAIRFLDDLGPERATLFLASTGYSPEDARCALAKLATANDGAPGAHAFRQGLGINCARCTQPKDRHSS